MRTLRTSIAMMAVWVCTCLPVLAQEGIAPYLEYAKRIEADAKRIEAARRLSALETGLFGEQVSLYSSGDMRHFNPCAYAFNNPYKFNDPDGRNPLGAIVGMVVEVGYQMGVEGKSLSEEELRR